MRLFGILLAAALALPGAAQQQPTRAAIVIRHELTVRGTTETGVPLRVTRPWPDPTFLVDSIRAADQVRRVYTRLLQVDANANGTAASAVFSPSRPMPDTALTRRMLQRRTVLAGGAGVVFEEQILASIFRMPSRQLRAGARWLEPWNWQIERNGVSASERGTRGTTVLRDTLIGGRVNWILRDSTALVREDAWPEHSYSLGQDVAHTRRGPGTRTGIWIYDPGREHAHARADTLTLDVEVSRAFPDGRTVSVQSRISRFDRWIVYAPAEFDRWRAERMAEARRSSGGMVRVAYTPLQQRLAQGDAAAVDSLINAWRSADTEDRITIERELGQSRPPIDWRKRLHQTALDMGDTLSAFLHTAVAARSYAQPFDSAGVNFVLPFLEDPARAFRNGFDVDAAYDHIFYTFMNRPPALAAESASVCQRNVCDLFERYIDRTDVDPRLRDLGVISAFFRNPRTGFPLLEARARTGTAIVQRVHREALGYAFESNQPGRGQPMPAPNSDWTAWAQWAGGGVGNRPLSVNARVLRLYALRTGRDFGAEFRTAYAQAQHDTARYTFGMLLLNVTPNAFSEEEITSLLESGESPLVSLGRSALNEITAKALPATDRIAQRLLDGLIGFVVEGAAPPWETGNPRLRIDYHGRSGLALITDSLPPGLRTRWEGKVQLLSDGDWRARDPREPGTAFKFRVRRVSTFVVLHYDYSERLDTPADAAPRHYAGGGTIVLLRTPTGWKEVSRGGWVT